TYSPVGGGAKGSITPKVKMVDVTDFNAPGYEKSIPGLIGADVSLECFYEPSDTGQGILLTALPARSRVWVRVYRDATHYSGAASTPGGRPHVRIARGNCPGTDLVGLPGDLRMLARPAIHMKCTCAKHACDFGHGVGKTLERCREQEHVADARVEPWILNDAV